MYSPAQQRHFADLSKKLLQETTSLFPAAPDQLASDLRTVLNYHDWRYYVQHNPVVSDYEYDMLYKKLQALEHEHPELVTPDSPTQRVASDLTESFASVPHLTPMRSLENSYHAGDLRDFDLQVRKFGLLPPGAPVEYVVEPKFDGGSIALVYENDRLVRAATRGDGTLGEEMTPNARVIRSIPLQAAFSKYGIHKAELRGEVLIRKDVFEKINQRRAAENLEPFANPRNAAAGGLRMKDPRETAQRGLEAFVYTFGYAADADGNDLLDHFPTHEKSLFVLADLGFHVPGDAHKVCSSIEEVIQFCLDWEQHREDYPYEIDGMVVKVNSRALQSKAGSTSHHPRWAIAFKFKAKQATTKLIGVEFQVGKIGSITPVGKLEPVPLAGVTISSVSLHNEDFIREKDIRLGDTVLMERAGEVIPYIVKSLPELRDGTEAVIEFPQNCPVCASPLFREADEAAWRCVNYDCEAQVLQRMMHHASKDAMDIEGLGRSIIERFFQLGWLHGLIDIYRLDYQRIAQLDGFGEKSASNLRASIERAKRQPIHRLLYGLSIHHLGKKVSQLLAAEVGHVLDLRNWTLDDFTHIKDVGPVVSANVIAFFANPRNIHLLEELESLGVNLRQTPDDLPRAIGGEGPLTGKSILFTGTLSKMSRKEAQEKAEAAGARLLSGVSANLDILVVGADAGSKLKKAQALGTVQILSEEEFLGLV
jgi:DNA ligase (NAD+)